MAVVIDVSQLGSEQVPDDELELIASEGFEDWMLEAGCSLVFGTPPAKLWLIGLDEEGHLAVFDRTLDKVMGLARQAGGRLWVATRYEIWRFDDVLRPGETFEGHDLLLAPRAVYPVGDVNIHDLAVDSGGRDIWVNTRFGCLASTSAEHSFVPRWVPPFLGKVLPGDRCHLNGLALRDGEPSWVTCVGTSTVVDGWRAERTDGGCVIDVATDEIVVRGLSMPHSPRWHQDRLWLTNAGTGELGVADFASGRFEPVAFIPGFTRGLSFVGPFALVGSSKPRRGGVYSGLPLDEALASRGMESHLGVFVVDTRSGELVAWLLIEGAVRELFDVCVLPGVRRPAAVGLIGDGLRKRLWADVAPPSATGDPSWLPGWDPAG